MDTHLLLPPTSYHSPQWPPFWSNLIRIPCELPAYYCWDICSVWPISCSPLASTPRWRNVNTTRCGSRWHLHPPLGINLHHNSSLLLLLLLLKSGWIPLTLMSDVVIKLKLQRHCYCIVVLFTLACGICYLPAGIGINICRAEIQKNFMYTWGGKNAENRNKPEKEEKKERRKSWRIRPRSKLD